MADQRAGRAATSSPPDGLTSRERILWAAATMLGEGPDAALSVRAVAERARVSPGSLRHHFPTQRALMEEVLGVVYDLVLPAGDMRDTSVPPRDRLLSFVTRLLSADRSTSTRDAWLSAWERYVATEPSQAMRAEYAAIRREALRRVEAALQVLQDEGALPPGDIARRARFIVTVVNGVSIEQVLPVDDAQRQTEMDVLRDTVDAVLGGAI